VEIIPEPSTIPPIPLNVTWISGAMMGCIFTILYWLVAELKNEDSHI